MMMTHNERIAQLHPESEARTKYVEMNLSKATEKLKALSDLMDRQQQARGQ